MKKERIPNNFNDHNPSFTALAISPLKHIKIIKTTYNHINTKLILYILETPKQSVPLNIL